MDLRDDTVGASWIALRGFSRGCTAPGWAPAAGGDWTGASGVALRELCRGRSKQLLPLAARDCCVGASCVNLRGLRICLREVGAV